MGEGIKMTSEEFHVARYNGVLSVMKKERDQYFELQKKYDALVHQLQRLAVAYMGTINDCIDKKHKLREKIKKQKEDFVKDIDKLYESEYFKEHKYPEHFFVCYKKIKSKWEEAT